MKIKDELDRSGVKTIIPDTNREELPQFFVDMGYKVGVEVGVWDGKFSEKLAEVGLQVYGVDPYKTYDDCQIYGKPENHYKAYETAKERLSKYPNYRFIKEMSMEAIKEFRDESIDFVYIDGNHRFKFVAEDIYEWSKKVKKGGVISGHDYITIYNFVDVKFVVDAYVASYRIPKWYVLGRKHAKKGEKRDKFRSFFWFKQ